MPGRNDPCPCGSGRKYKNCCLQKDRSKRVRESAWRREELATLQKLTVFAQRPEYAPQLVVASNLFWNGNYGPEALNRLDREDTGRFLDWFVFDYPLEGTREALVEVFARQAGARLLPGESQRIAAWVDSHLSLYIIEGPAEGTALASQDLLQGMEVLVSREGIGQLGLAGDLVMGRLLRSTSPPHFSWAAVLLPASLQEGLVGHMRQLYQRFRERRVDASWPDVLSQRGYSLSHYLLREASERGRPLQAQGRYYDAYPATQVLAELEKELQERMAQESERRIREQRPREDPAETLRQTQGGILLPGHVKYKGIQDKQA